MPTPLSLEVLGDFREYESGSITPRTTQLEVPSFFAHDDIEKLWKDGVLGASENSGGAAAAASVTYTEITLTNYYDKIIKVIDNYKQKLAGTVTSIESKFTLDDVATTSEQLRELGSKLADTLTSPELRGSDEMESFLQQLALDASKLEGLFSERIFPFKELVDKRTKAIKQITAYEKLIKMIEGDFTEARDIIFPLTYQHKPSSDSDERVEPKPSGDSDGGVGPMVTRLTLFTEKLVGLKLLDSLLEETLHPIELISIIKAIDLLKSCPGAFEVEESDSPTGYKENIVLVDVLARKPDPKDSKKKVFWIDDKIKSKDVLEFHTIVLWKINDKAIMVIDPNNQTNTYTFLQPLFELLRYQDYELFHMYNSSESCIEGLTGYLTKNFYQAERSTFGRGIRDAAGGCTSNVRDCTDIAVKIAFAINEFQKDEYLRRELTDSQKVWFILDKLFLSMSITYDSYPREEGAEGKIVSVPAKIKLIRDAHSSDSEIRKRFTGFVESYFTLRYKLPTGMVIKPIGGGIKPPKK